MSEPCVDLGPLDEMTGAQSAPRGEPPLEFLDPTAIREYQPPAGMQLVGENHIVRGSAFVIGGAPGVGKSRASVALAVAGALGKPWFGLTTHRQFKTLIIQNENGRLRLKDEFSELPCEELNGWIKVSAPPPFGFAFESPEFAHALQSICTEWQPDVVLIDPWNAVARDDKASDYLAAFKAIRSIIPAGESSPGIGIVAHTRKPKTDERASGRSLLNLLAGSYVLGSVARSVFVIQAATDDPEDDRVVFTCCKNNDGPMPSPSAWGRRNGLFVPVPDFDWEEFQGRGNGAGKRMEITKDDLGVVFQGDSIGKMTRKRAVELLCERNGCSQSAAYGALSLTGRFKDHLREVDGFLSWHP